MSNKSRIGNNMEKAVLVVFSVDLLIMSSIIQPNKHYVSHIYYFYQISPTCFGVLYAILRDNFVYLLETVIYLQGCYIRCVIKYKIYHFL